MDSLPEATQSDAPVAGPSRSPFGLSIPDGPQPEDTVDHIKENIEHDITPEISTSERRFNDLVCRVCYIGLTMPDSRRAGPRKSSNGEVQPADTVRP